MSWTQYQHPSIPDIDEALSAIRLYSRDTSGARVPAGYVSATSVGSFRPHPGREINIYGLLRKAGTDYAH